VAKSTHILHNTMKPSTRQAAVEHEAWARGTRGPELKDQDQGPEPGDQDQGARTRGPEPSSRSRRQDRDPDKNRHRAPRLENNQVQRGRDLGTTRSTQTKTRSRKWTEVGEGKEELSEKINPLYTPRRNAVVVPF
jgi:hypothetical protein